MARFMTLQDLHKREKEEQHQLTVESDTRTRAFECDLRLLQLFESKSVTLSCTVVRPGEEVLLEGSFSDGRKASWKLIYPSDFPSVPPKIFLQKEEGMEPLDLPWEADNLGASSHLGAILKSARGQKDGDSHKLSEEVAELRAQAKRIQEPLDSVSDGLQKMDSERHGVETWLIKNKKFILPSAMFFGGLVGAATLVVVSYRKF